MSRSHLLVYLLVGWVALCEGPRRAWGQEERPQQWQDSSTPSGRWGRRLHFNMNELHRMETLQAAEEQVLAVMDGRSKPLFGQQLLFQPQPVVALFGRPAGVHLDEVQQQQQQQRQQQQQQQSGAAASQGGKAVSGRTQGRQQLDAGDVAGHPPAIRPPSVRDPRPNRLGSERQRAGDKSAPASKDLEVTTSDPAAPTNSRVQRRRQQQQQQQEDEEEVELQWEDPPQAQRSLAAEEASRRAMLRDWEAADAAGEVPEPELQYKDEEGGGRILIWLPQDTLPLDVLVGHRPQVWLYTLLRTDYDAPTLLPHFLDHYIKLGIHPGNMLFLVHHDPLAVGAATPDGLLSLTSLLGEQGLDYRVWKGQYSPEAHLRNRLQVLAHVPVRDWVVLAAPDEFQEYGGLTAPHFFAQQDKEGVNCVRGALLDRVSAAGELAPVATAPSLFSQFPLKCDVSRKVAHAQGTKVAAFKGYLRPGPNDDTALGMLEARRYFGPGEGDDGAGRRGACGSRPAEDLLPLTPYGRYWKFYKAPDVQGNVYLWDAREGDAKVKVQHFRWRAGVERRVADRLRLLREEVDACGGTAEPLQAKALEEAQRIQDTIIAKGAIDIINTYLRCQLAEEPRLPQPRPRGRAARAAAAAEAAGAGAAGSQ
ncbi:hypothetical protein N2152v2_007662 [Parachlorella kessleri]